MAMETSTEFSFEKSLKEDAKYPVLNYFRVERYFTRPLASLLVRMVFKTNVTPNQLTVVSFFIGLAASLVYLKGEPVYFVWGGILAQLSSIVDCSDGMLARSKGLTSKYGAFLDLFLDRITDFFLFTCISVGQYFYSGDLKLLIACLVGIGLYFLQVTLYYLTRNYLGITKTGEAAEPRGLLIFLILVFSVANQLDILMIITIISTVINNIIKVINLIRLGRVADG